MKKIIKFLSYSLLAGLFMIALSGCGSTATVDPNANKLIIWSFESEDAWKPIIKDFQKNVKDVTVVYQKQVFNSSYENRVLNSSLSGQGPDVWAMPNDWVYRHKDKLISMPATMAKGINFDSAYVPAIKESVVFDNKIYALAPSAEPLMVYYNPKLFEATRNSKTKDSKDQAFNKRVTQLLQGVPKTWSDFSETAKLLTIKNGATITQSGVAIGTNQITNSTDILYLLMLQNETQILSTDYKLATFNLPKDTSTGTKDTPGKRALEFYTSFAKPEADNYSWQDNLGNDLDAFANGKVAMVFGYSSLQNYFLQKYPDFQYKKAFVPELGQESNKIVDYARFNAFGVNKLSKNPTASWQLINQIIASSDSFNSSNKLYTSKKATSYDISIKNREGTNPEKQSLATAHSLVRGRFPQEFDQFLSNSIASVNSNTQNPLTALDFAANKTTDLLRKGDW